MKYLNTKHKRNSASLTALIMLLILLLLFFVASPPFMDPPEEYGVAVNFGTSNVGSGDVQPNEPIKSEANNSEKQFNESSKSNPEEVVKPEEVQKEAAAAPQEKLLTQDTQEALEIKRQKEQDKKNTQKSEIVFRPMTQERATQLNNGGATQIVLRRRNRKWEVSPENLKGRSKN